MKSSGNKTLSRLRIFVYPVLGSMAVIALITASSCTTMPDPKMPRFEFPKGDAFVGKVDRPYAKLGLVKTKVNYPSLDWVHSDNELCDNYYNKAVQDLVSRARKHGADAVIDVRSVVFLETGEMEIHKTPQCADDGAEGQILAEGIAVKWVKPKKQ